LPWICSTSIEIPAPDAKPGTPGGVRHMPTGPAALWSVQYSAV
jgi:hypothetical protein